MGVPATAQGRFYVECPAGVTVLQEREGRRGDDIDWIWVAAGAGSVSLYDGANLVFTWDVLTVERFIPLNLKSRLGAWSIDADASAVAAGAFS